MATITEKTYQSQPDSDRDGVGISLPAVARMVLNPLASLKLTVALFAMGIFIIWVGTLAQGEKDMWDVIHDYFWTPIAFIELQFLFPYQWLPFDVNIPLSLGFPFPGGSTIGVIMAVNLLAAHLVRFKIQAKGMRLVWGLVIVTAGAILTLLVIASGHNSEGLQGNPPFEWSELWLFVKLGGAVAWIALAFLLTRIEHKTQPILSWVTIVATVIFGSLMIWVFTSSFYPGDPALRIMWQLIQGGLAGVVVLIGCLFLFKKRAGIVVIHLAVGLLLIGESFVSYYNVEEQIRLLEGESVNYARDIRSTELAVVDTSQEKTEHHTVVPESRLDSGKLIRDEQLPFDLELVDYYKNAILRPVRPDDENPATAGTGLQFMAESRRPASGADSSGAVDLAAAYVRVLDKQDGKELGTYLVSQQAAMLDHTEKVALGDKSYQMALRFKRNYKPYTIHLHDVQKNEYVGTSRAKDYRSIITLVDPSRSVNREGIAIWMNNPLRYAGETFYQADHQPARTPGGPEQSALQVVTNTGWMIPYVACMMALAGMAFHFMLTFARFTRRVNVAQHDTPLAGWSLGLTLAAVAVGLVIMGYSLKPAGSSPLSMNIQEFAELPLAEKGRTKPFDSYARTTLQVISDRQTFQRNDDADPEPAVVWLLEVVAKPKEAADYNVFRIRNHEVLELLELEDSDDDRYSLLDIEANFTKLLEQIKQTHEADEKGNRLSAYQRELLQLEKRLKTYNVLIEAMQPIQLPEIPSREKLAADADARADLAGQMRAMMQILPQRMGRLEQMEPPMAAFDSHTGDWQAYSVAWELAQARERIPYLDPSQKVPEGAPSAAALNAIFTAYGKGNVKQFNNAVANYRQLIDSADPPPVELSTSRVTFEAFFNRAQPFMYSMVIYLLGFVIAAIGMLAWHREMNRAALAILCVGLVLHTFALIARVYISGRPPVTNLYSSAVFIGWGGVVLCLLVELIYKMGIGNLVAAVCGVSTLIIAGQLGLDGDTFEVLVAVLDTQFWLTTHVICVTLGYATTFVAGLFGIVYLLGRLVSPEFIADKGKDIARMCYGVVCFAIFFSFLGTVLGGLWADDSWGRFWGWDPKENGALIIVLWNALILHARWGGMIKDRGLATLAVAGNIVTSWSWFGVNQLGIGLHSYGFTNGVVLSLTLFVISQLIIMATAAIPARRIWALPVTR